MAATLERMLDALAWFQRQPFSREYLVLECHPSTSTSEAANDLILGPDPGHRLVLCEVTDVVSTSASQNRKESKDLRALGCGTDVPQDGVRRFICTSREFGEALTSPNRHWDRVPYRYKRHSVGASLLLELLAALDHAQSQRTAAP